MDDRLQKKKPEKSDGRRSSTFHISRLSGRGLVAVALLTLSFRVVNNPVQFTNDQCQPTTNDGNSHNLPTTAGGHSGIPKVNRSSSAKDDLRFLAEITNSPSPGSLKCPEGLTPIYDRILDENALNNTNTTKKKIPKIIHISYKSRCVPSEVFGRGIQRWKDEMPDHSFYFHDDDAVNRLIALDWPEFPEIHNLMRCIKYKGAMKIDLWRMVVIYRFGGIYADIDNVPAKQFKNGDAILPEDTFFSSSDGNDRPCQNVFAMEPRHPIALFAVRMILKNLWDMPSLRKPRLVWTTGPYAFSQAYKSYLDLTLKGKAKEKPFQPGIYKGFMNKQIHKVPNWNWLNPVGQEQVEYKGFNTSKKERDIQISGQYHWARVAYWNRKGVDYSCREYLYRLDHPGPDNNLTESWKVETHG